MSTFGLIRVHLALAILAVAALAQVSTVNGPHPDYSKEGAVVEQIIVRVDLHSDGTSTREQHTRVQIKSGAGVQLYGVLRLPYQSAVEHVDIPFVRVLKPQGTVVLTPPDAIQDMTSEVSREAPFYSDLREKHVAVKGLEAGDTLEYSIHVTQDKALAPGQFWFSYQFARSAIILDEELEISVPRDREVKLKCKTLQPTQRDEAGRRFYLWKTSNLETENLEQQEEQTYDSIRGLLPAPDVLISSFRSWEEVGRWYEHLQQEKIVPSPEINAKAEELTKGLSDDDSKVRAIYNYVSLRYRYVGIAFGIGRYQPHTAAEILGNQYGDCKDKHTLLAALLSAIGIRAYPALINNRAVVDADVPSPGQFSHVISVVAQENKLLWMDTTTEVMAMGYLVAPLRGKPALVITADKVTFQTTPANPPSPNKEDCKVTAKFAADGALNAHEELTLSGDGELYFRYVFRRVPESQWKEFGQKIFYGARLGGTITDVQVSPPEKTEVPLALKYDYTLKDFTEGDKHRFVVPLPVVNLPELSDQDETRKIPLWIGYAIESQYESRVELPKRWSTSPTAPIHLSESFAEYSATSEIKEGVLVTKRLLVVKTHEVTPDQLKNYKAFQKAISDDHGTYMILRADAGTGANGPGVTANRGPSLGIERFGEWFQELPSSSNVDALQAESDGRKAMGVRDFASAILAFKHAVTLDEHFSRAWIELASTYEGKGDKKSAVSDFQQAVEADPKQSFPYKVLANKYVEMGKLDEAIATWQRLKGITPDDNDIAANLGAIYTIQKRYADAVPFFEASAKANPSDAYTQLRLGIAQLRLRNTDQGVGAFRKTLEIDSSAEMLNNVAYELAEAETNLPEALADSQRSVKELEEKSRKVDLGNIQKSDLQLPLLISAHWDTLGWIYFKLGDMARAESYLDCSWHLLADGTVGDHLGQVLEKEHKLPAAIHMYNLALEINPRMQDTSARMRKLAQVHLPAKRMRAVEELSNMRTVPLPPIIKENASADFNIVQARGGKIEKAIFVDGSPLLRNAGDTLEKAQFKQPFPAESTAQIVRRGLLSCGPDSGCSFVFYPLSAASGAK